jgi:hypothetical protein
VPGGVLAYTCRTNAVATQLPVDNESDHWADSGTIPRMSFTDLPEDWPTRPLTDPVLVADVLDLLVSDADRASGALLFALCDRDARLLQPCVLPDGSGGEPAQRERAVSVFVDLLADLDPDGSLLVAVARPKGLSATAADLDRRAAVERACAGKVALLGVHIVTREGSRPLPRAA